MMMDYLDRHLSYLVCVWKFFSAPTQGSSSSSRLLGKAARFWRADVRLGFAGGIRRTIEKCVAVNEGASCVR